MERESIETRLNELRNQLTDIVNKIELERHESKDDEQSVLDELMSNKGIVEEEITNLESALNKITIEKLKSKNYILEHKDQLLKISIVPESLVDNTKGFISKESPLAQAILKTKAGKSFIITTPAGELQYKLRNIVK